jgi:hypothetical protein
MWERGHDAKVVAEMKAVAPKVFSRICIERCTSKLVMDVNVINKEDAAQVEISLECILEIVLWRSSICMEPTAPPLQFGLQRWGVRLHLFLAGSRGVLSFVLAFELLLRGRLQGWSGYCICMCAHQTGYRGQWRD